ncbi:MAG: DUF3990 domain-containing protein [Treponema sp.]|nr:DUF3990 domain-containing protein [Treponema sp.]
MIVYHGSTVIVKNPDIRHSAHPLDFGKGFYVTTNKEQAVRWARRKAGILHAEKSFVNIYDMKDDLDGLKLKVFPEDLHEWIDFVCHCRDNGTDYLQFDLISGMVADDKVFRVVDLYHSGIWDKERALQEIKVYPNYDQTAFITQIAIDKLLTFKSYEEV